MSPRQHRHRSTTGDAWQVLGSYRRRVVLAVVSSTDGAVRRGDLARAVLEAEADRRSEDATASELDAVEVRLHHVDLPRLAAADLISYRPDRGTVEADTLPLEGEEWLEMPVVEALEAWNGPR